MIKFSIGGKITRINGKATLSVKFNGTDYPLITSNATAVEAYLHTGDQAYLKALASKSDLDKYGGKA